MSKILIIVLLLFCHTNAFARSGGRMGGGFSSSFGKSSGVTQKPVGSLFRPTPSPPPIRVSTPPRVSVSPVVHVSPTYFKPTIAPRVSYQAPVYVPRPPPIYVPRPARTVVIPIAVPRTHYVYVGGYQQPAPVVWTSWMDTSPSNWNTSTQPVQYSADPVQDDDYSNLWWVLFLVIIVGVSAFPFFMWWTNRDREML